MQFPDRVRIVFDNQPKSSFIATIPYDLDTGETLKMVQSLTIRADATHLPEAELIFLVPADDPAEGFKRVGITYSWPNLRIESAPPAETTANEKSS